MYISAMVEQIPVKRRVTTADISDEEAIISEEGVVMNEDNEEPSFLIIDRYPRKRNRISRGCWFTFRLYIDHEFYTNITDATSVATHLYEDEMLNDSEDESEENQFYVEGDPETFVEEIDAAETQPNEIFKCRRGKLL